MIKQTKNELLAEKVQKAKSSAIRLAMSPPLNEIREVLVILKTKGMSVAKITDFLRKENFKYTRGQVRYYLVNNPISMYELSNIEFQVTNEKNNQIASQMYDSDNSDINRLHLYSEKATYVKN